MSDADEKMNIGLFGGSFDPVHNGHIRAARAFIKQFSPEKLLIMPCRIPPHKSRIPRASDEARLRMLKVAFVKDKAAEISDFELKKDGVSYTVETLRELKKKYPRHKILFVVGTDVYLTLLEWKEPTEIFRLCEPCVYARGDKRAETERYAEKLKSEFGLETHFIKGNLTDVSSSELRGLLSEDKRTKGMLPRAVKRVIDETGIYHSEEYHLRVYRQASKALVDSERYEHILGVEKAASALAKRYGADEYKARAAALLHDITKQKTLREQLNLADKFGIIEGKDFEEIPQIAHAFTGSAYAEHRFYVTDAEILNAVRFHTTGRANMSLLEKIIFLADVVEEGRTFAGVEALRAAAFRNLDEAMLMSLHATREKTEKLKIRLHPYTAEAIEFLRI